MKKRTDVSIDYESLFEQFPDAIVAVDPAGTVLDLNDAARRLFGGGREEFAGRTLAGLFPENGAEIAAGIRHVLDRKRHEFDLRGLVTGEETREFHVTGTLVNAGGSDVIQTVWRDITEIKWGDKALRESEEKYRTLFESATDAVFILDLSGRFIDVNHTAYERLGYTKDELMSLHISQLDPPEFAVRVPMRFAQIQEHGFAVFESAHLKKDGTHMAVEINCRIISYEGKKAIFSIIRDITRRKQAESALVELNGRLQALVQAIPDLVFFKDLEGRHLIVNKAVEEFTGLRAGEFLGRTASDLLPPDLACACNASDGEALRKLKPLHFEEFFHAGAEEKYLDTIKAPIFDAEGRPAGILAISRDITERKRAEQVIMESEERLLAILDSLDAIVYVADMKTHEIIITNRYASSLFGDITGKICWQTIQKGQTGPCPFCTNGKLLDSSGRPTGTFEWEFRNTVTQRWYYILDRAIRWVDGRIVRLEIATDITEKKLAEEELTRSRFEIQRHALELEAAYKDMESFSYAVSHDLKAPIRRIEGFSEILVSDYRDKIDDFGKDLLQRIVDNTEKMRQLIDDLLSFSRYSTREIEKSDADMRALVQSVFDDLRPAADGRDVELILGDLPRAYGDSAMLEQVFANLLSNAIKFTRNRTRTVIEVAGQDRENESVYWVRDNGIGFDMEFSNKLFGLFQRIHLSKNFEGSGVGLVIVKKIIEKHGGRVWAEGKPDEGAVFYLALPKGR